MEQQLLRDPLVNPDDAVLESALGKKHAIYREFTAALQEFNLVPEWHYYQDGKSWLGKVMHKKKNLCWLSVWNTGFKMTFYFPEQYLEGFYQLDISEDIKQSAREMKPVGKSHPVILLISSKKILKDAMKIVCYKMTLK
jgi:hypothetical protein